MNRLVGWMRIGILDLRGDARRFIILLACLALGVGAIAAVSSVGAALQAAVQRDAQVILGGDIEVRQRGGDLTGPQRAALEALGQTARVVDINARATAGGNSALLSLRAVSDTYPLLGTVTVAPATAQPLQTLLSVQNGVPGAVVDRKVLDRLGVSLGDTIRIGNADFVVRATLVSLPDQAALGFQLGLPAIVNEDTLAAAGLQQQGVLSRFSYKVMLRNGNATAALDRLQTAFPDADWELREPKDAAANLKRFSTLR